MPSIEDAVVNGILCYISTARNSHSDQTISSICQSFYKYDVITKGKEVLFEITGAEYSKRRGNDKLKSEVNDIIQEFRRIDENNISVPAFMANSCNDMPPASGFEVLSEHIIMLLTEINNLRSQVGDLKESVNQIKDCNVSDIKEELYDIKNIILSKSFVDNNQHKSLPHAVTPYTNNKVNNVNKSKGNNLCSEHTSKQSSTIGKRPSMITDATTSSRDDADNILEDINKWQVVRRKKKREHITGLKKTDGTFKGIGRTLDVFIGRCDLSVDSNIIKNYISNDIGISVLSCECISAESSRVKSFKVTVAAVDRDKLLVDSLWPVDVSVRKFYKPRKNDRSE